MRLSGPRKLNFFTYRYIRALQKSQPCCPLCHRDFEQQNEARSLVDELMGKIREVPNKLQENKSQLEERQSKYNKLLTLKSKHDEISHLKEKEIPGLRSELEKVESTLKKVQKELADIGKEMNGPQSDEALCLSLLVGCCSLMGSIHIIEDCMYIYLIISPFLLPTE